MKVAIDIAPDGSFVLSEKATRLYNERTGLNLKSYQFDNQYFESEGGVERHDPVLIQIIEELGCEASSLNSDIRIIEIPDNTQYYVERNYDEACDIDMGEFIVECHREWHYNDEE